MRLRGLDLVVFFLISILLPAAAQSCSDRGVILLLGDWWNGASAVWWGQFQSQAAAVVHPDSLVSQSLYPAQPAPL